MSQTVHPSQAEINRRMRRWEDAAFRRYAFRVALLKRRGLTQAVAEFIADLLALRDQERDDRRMCLECLHLQVGGGCFAASMGWLPQTAKAHHPVRDLLQRCERFEWLTP